MKISVKFLGYARIALRRKEMVVDLPRGARLSDGVARVVEVLGPVAERALLQPGGGYSVLFSLNGRAAEPSAPLSDGDEVTFFPPSAGGAWEEGGDGGRRIPCHRQPCLSWKL